MKKNLVPIVNKKLINEVKFKRRIIGLTSYFKSAQEELLPSYVKTEAGDIYHVEKMEMTDHQFGIYEKIRKVEHNKEKTIKTLKRMKNSIRLLLSCIGFLMISFTQAQTGVISGQIIDESGVEMPGASVLIEGSQNGTMTDFDGNFKQCMRDLAAHHIGLVIIGHCN